MRHFPRVNTTKLVRYALALDCAVGLLLGEAAFGRPFRVVFFSFAIATGAIVTWALGTGPGIVAAGLTSIAVVGRMHGSSALEQHRQWIQLLGYWVSAGAVVALVDALGRHRREDAVSRNLVERPVEPRRRHVFIDEYGAEVYGVPVANLLSELGVPAEQIADWRAQLDRVSASGQQQTVESGHHVWARLTLSLVRDAAGKPDYEVAVVEDISEQKLAAAALQASEAPWTGFRLRAGRATADPKSIG